MNSPNNVTFSPEAQLPSIDGALELSPSKFFSPARVAEIAQSLDRIQVQVEGFEVR